MGTTPLAQTVRSISFETWCANHEDSHRARWCRELYPWQVFANGDYSDAAVGSEQRVGHHGLTVLEKRPGKLDGRTEFRVKLVTTGTTQGVVWRNGRWDDDFVLVAANDGHFITLFTKREDPAKNALMDLMTGRFDSLEASRCLPWSALLFRTLVAELAASQDPWDRHVAFDATVEPVRVGYRSHPQYQPDGRPIVPFLSAGRDRWLMFGFTEEKAHRQALFCEGQCRLLLTVFCHPTLTPHHRSRSPQTRVVSLFELAELGGSGRRFLPQIRFLTNHMRLADADVPVAQAVDRAAAALAAAAGPQDIATSELREAHATLGMEVRTFGDVAYALAAANLLNAATNPRSTFYRGSQKPPKEAYAFKKRVGRWIDGLVEHPVDGVRVYVELNGSVYVTVGDVQFSFHALANTPVLARFRASGENVRQEWGGRRLQPIAPSVLAWGRAVFQAERLDDESQDAG